MKGYACNHGQWYQSTPFLEGSLSTSQAVNVGAYHHVVIAADGVPIWVKFGDSTVVATVGTNGEKMIPAQGWECFDTSPAQTYVAIIESRPSASASVDLFG